MSLPVVAVDFGASSIRVCRVDLNATPPAVEVCHRYAHGPLRHADGSLRWDWERLVAETYRGLERALAAGAVVSIGIDSWGVDYGLLDARGELVAPPFSYRDGRTDGYRDAVAGVGERRLYEIAGLQVLPFNTIFQLAAHDREELARARRLLMLPELLVHELTGAEVAEVTSAGTTGLLDLATCTWSEELIAAVGIDRSLFARIERAGTRVGEWRGIPVHLVGGHDTASAVVAMGSNPAPGTAFVSAGTWLLVGREQPRPDTSEEARTANFTNEQGALGGIRFLKNVAGFWLLEECRRAWGGPPVDELLAGAEAVGPDVPVVDATDERFLAPADMEAELRAAAGLPGTAGRPTVVRCIVESLAETTARVVKELGNATMIAVFGGGSRARLYLQRLAERSGVPVCPGPVEATALGNALVQGVALGRFAGIEEARAALEGDS